MGLAFPVRIWRALAIGLRSPCSLAPFFGISLEPVPSPMVLAKHAAIRSQIVNKGKRLKGLTRLTRIIFQEKCKKCVLAGVQLYESRVVKRSAGSRLRAEGSRHSMAPLPNFSMQ